ncbi:MAG: cytochrome P450 [Sphingomonadales bacterium]|jgi:cytochrome P450|nr:cytochrome P450 [Sphingomonadales bacterium]MBK6490775.1 cytochrome P450 [Sphingomonadales bacterium]MBK6719270.1 cytochrome P450 [Sphingomonadales bacterium]MBK7284343.1 cytochrome P450 [Sphingomonadales bacterium]MBK8860786.1 cytochrome P450 [Sphingomonadales bacterium]
MAYAHTHTANPHWLPPRQGQEIDYVPGRDGWPLVGTTFEQLKDPHAFTRKMVDKFGHIYRTNSFGGRFVQLIGPEANELVLFDRDKTFSSEQGWGPVLNLVFPSGLMLMDFDKHRSDRRTLSIAFKPEPMKLYSDALNKGIAARVAEWSGKTFAFYPAIKQLTLDLAAASFLGIPWGPDAQKINRAFVDMVQASIGVVRVPLPGTAMGRGVAGRKFLLEYFGREVPKRRASDAQDMFSQICRATKEDGTLLSDDEIIDHMNFLMMAAHDTITSSATSMVMLLARNPEWQVKLREEFAELGVNGDDLPYDRLNDLVLTDYAFKESLRMIPPVPSLPRRAIKPFSFGGYDFPAGTYVGIQPAYTHQMAEHWPDPEKFDPLRFEPEQVKARHKYAWVPFGGGAHMCLGLHFAYMQIKILMWHMLRNHRIDIGEGSGDKWQAWPIPKPRDGLPITLVPLDD